MKKKSLGLAPPQVCYANKVKAFFAEDPEITVVFNDEAKEPTLTLFVDSAAKAEGLSQLLPPLIQFGNITLHINIIPSNPATEKLTDTFSFVEAALKDNPAVVEIQSGTLFDRPIHYVIFKKEVVQYYIDDLGDFYGLNTTLYEDLARELLTPDWNIYYCTARE